MSKSFIVTSLLVLSSVTFASPGRLRIKAVQDNKAIGPWVKIKATQSNKAVTKNVKQPVSSQVLNLNSK